MINAVVQYKKEYLPTLLLRVMILFILFLEIYMSDIYTRLKTRKTKVAVVGMGYVGLPLAYEFDKVFDVVGFDINSNKIELMSSGIDPTSEVPEGGLKNTSIQFTFDPEKLKDCEFIVVAVPTPIDKNRRPDLCPLLNATQTVAQNMPSNSVIVFESTVYPGVTEEECVPILEKYSKLKYQQNFRVGYSPERINPGDKEHRLHTIVKVVSGCDKETLELVARIYSEIIDAGVHKASSIKVAEAAKVIENTQRDLNIALMNELALIFHKLDIDTIEVLKAAGTKWNFLKFYPGLVGGHCIGVDPYYLTYKAEETGYNPQVILSGRRINDNMGKYVAENTVKSLIRSGKAVKGSKVLLLGLTFKENVGDIRNTKVIDIISELNEYQVETIVHDPHASKDEVFEEYNIELSDLTEEMKVDSVIVAVAHDSFKKYSLEKILQWYNSSSEPVLIDIKGFYDKETAKKMGFIYWRL